MGVLIEVYVVIIKEENIMQLSNRFYRRLCLLQQNLRNSSRYLCYLREHIVDAFQYD